MQTQLQWLIGKQLRTFGQLIYFLAGVESPRLSVPFLRQFPFAKHESHKPALSANIVSVHLRFHWVEVRKIRYQFGFGDDGPLKPVPCLYFTACGCQILYSHYMFNLTQWHPPFTLIRIGLMTAVRYVLRLRRGGCLWGGLPCSAHVWIASGTTGKSPSFPRGDMSVPCTRKGNCLAAPFAYLPCLPLRDKSIGEVNNQVHQWLSSWITLNGWWTAIEVWLGFSHLQQFDWFSLAKKHCI